MESYQPFKLTQHPTADLATQPVCNFRLIRNKYFRNQLSTILQTIEWAKKFIFLRPLAIGDFLEPAVSSANTILQTILGPPFSWRWNRVATGFICVPGQQDYTIFNWQANTPSNH